jgi:transcriptional regulator with XRE-family HTH domain
MTIKEQRLSKHLTREKLAQLSGITQQTIWRAETSGRITYQTYLKIQNALDNYTPPADITVNLDQMVQVEVEVLQGV